MAVCAAPLAGIGASSLLPPLVEEIVDRLRHGRADAVDRAQVVGAGAGDGLGRAEMLEQRALAGRADAGDPSSGGPMALLRSARWAR